MAKSRHKVEKWQAKLGTTGLNPLEVIEMQDAIRARKKKVKFEDNREFNLKYVDSDTVYYSPVIGFAPSGYLKIKKFLEDL